MKPWLAIFGLAFLIRLGYILLCVSPAHLAAEDQLIYLAFAEAIPSQGWTAVTPDRSPGYPLVLSLVFSLFGGGQTALLVVQALIDSATCVGIGRLAQRVLSRGFVAAGVISAINLNMIVLSAMVLTDSLFLFLFVAALLFLVDYLASGKPRDFIGCIVLLALATMVRSVSYYLLPLLLVGLVGWSLYRRREPLRALGLGLMGLLVAGLILAPQHWRNWHDYGATGFVSQGGTHVLGWVAPAIYQYAGQGSYQKGQELARARLDRLLAEKGWAALPDNPFEASKTMGEAARLLLAEWGATVVVKAWIVGSAINLAAPSAAFAPVVRAMDHPSFYGTPGNGAIEKILNYVSSMSASGRLYLAILATGTVCSATFFLLAMYGGWRMAGSGDEFQRRVLVWLVLLVAYFFAITGPIIGSKYRLPIEPMLTVFVVAALPRICKRGLSNV